MPPKSEFSREMILDASLKIVREQGWEQLSARSIANVLQCSTRPVYSCFTSMQEIKDILGRKVNDMLLDYQFRAKTGKPLLSMGVGYVLFARDEPELFRLYYLPHICSFDLEQEMRSKAQVRLLDQMNNSPEVPQLNGERAEKLLLKLKIFAHGLACYITAGTYEFGEGEIVSLISEAGRAFFKDEMSEIEAKNEVTD